MIIQIGEIMFGAKYSRIKFWLLSILIIIVASPFMAIAKAVPEEGAEAILSILISVLLIHVLANRIREFGSSPWIALWAIVPFVGLFQAFYFGCKKSGKITQQES